MYTGLGKGEGSGDTASSITAISGGLVDVIIGLRKISLSDQDFAASQGGTRNVEGGANVGATAASAAVAPTSSPTWIPFAVVGGLVVVGGVVLAVALRRKRR